MADKLTIFALLDDLEGSMLSIIKGAEKADTRRVGLSDKIDYGLGRISRDEYVSKQRKHQKAEEFAEFSVGRTQEILVEIHHDEACGHAVEYKGFPVAMRLW